MQKNVSLRNLANYLLNITHFYDPKKFRKLFYLNTFVLLLLALFGTSSQIFKLKGQNLFSGILYPSLKKFQKWTPRNKKFENPSTTYKFYVGLGPKRYFGPRDPIIRTLN